MYMDCFLVMTGSEARKHQAIQEGFQQDLVRASFAQARPKTV